MLKQGSNKVILTRQQFYNLIWSAPLSQLAKQYAISDNGLRKMCTKYNIPIPKNGYWMKLKFNKPVKKEKLLDPYIDKDQIEIYLREEGSDINLDSSPETLLMRAIKSDAVAPITVSDELIRPHLLIKETKRYWADRKKHKRDGNYDKSIPHLGIYVENEHRPRALRFFDTLIKLVEHRGHKVIVKDQETFVVIGEVETKISLREASTRVLKTEGRWQTSELVPNGKLILKSGKYSFDKDWRDNKTLLESMLPKIMARLELDAQKEAEWREKSRIAAIKRSEEDRIRKEKEAIQKAEQGKFDILLKQAERYDKAEKIRAMIAGARTRFTLENRLTQKMEEWIEWATAKADWYDPLCITKDDILEP